MNYYSCRLRDDLEVRPHLASWKTKMGKFSPMHQNLKSLVLLHLTLSVTALSSCLGTDSGQICGTSVTYNGQQVSAFLGIPFAEPPVKDLRFRKPVPVKPWNGTLNATELEPACPQQFKPAYPWADTTSLQAEDCLYLNIWVPPNTNPNSRKAVMFWIFSGGFAQGSGGLPVYDGSVLASEGDILVVTINYRVSILGFLSTIPPTEEAPGNMGFYDMVEALDWVRKNVHHFGGDSDNLTISGHSAGGISAGYMCTSPLTKGKFQKAILQSGNSALLSSDSRLQNAVLAKKVAEKLGCDKIKSDEMVECLRNKSARALVETTKNSHPLLMGFAAITGDEFLPTDPKVQLVSGTFHDAKIIIGDVPDEGSFYLAACYVGHYGAFGEKTSRTSKSRGENSIRKVLKDFPAKEVVVKYYLGNVSDADEPRIIEQAHHAYGDLVACPSQYFAERYSGKGLDVYFYYFNHRPSVTPWSSWLGVAHFDEIAFVFGRPLDHPEDYTQAEQSLSREMVKSWSSFVKTGSPGSNWTKYSGNYSDIKIFSVNEGTPKYLPTIRKNCEFYRPLFGYPPPTPSLAITAPSLAMDKPSLPPVSSGLK